jgi:hypothetical protein
LCRLLKLKNFDRLQSERIHRLQYAGIGAAYANILHLLGQGGAMISVRQRSRARQDLPRLAIAALRNLIRNPRNLDWVTGVWREALDGGYHMSDGILYWSNASPNCCGAVRDHSTRAADTLSAAILRARHVEEISYHPQQRHLGVVHSNVNVLTVYVQRVSTSHRTSSYQGENLDFRGQAQN